LHKTTSALVCAPGASIVDQYAPHQLRRDRKEVRAVLPLHAARLNQLEIGFINQRSSLQRMAGPLTADVSVGQAPQFSVDQRDQSVERRLIPARPGD
jgi:hypothetical protein